MKQDSRKSEYEKNSLRAIFFLPAYLFQNIWIKALKKEDIIRVLKPNKNLLQTVSINIYIKDKEEIVRNLAKVGVTRITPLGDNSRMLPGESHDGEYALRRYIRIVETVK